MKKFSNMKLSRYTDTLLQANDILKIAKYMHENRKTLPELFSTGTDKEVQMRSNVNSLFNAPKAGQLMGVSTVPDERDTVEEFYDVFRFETGTTKTVHDSDEDGNKIQGTEKEVPDTSTVDIYVSNIGTRSTQFYKMNGVDVSLAFSPAKTFDFRVTQFMKDGQDTKSFIHVPFDEYSTAENLNKVAWLFRAIDPQMMLMVGYLIKHECPGIDLYYQDIPKLMEILGLTRSTMLDIIELQ